MYSWLGGQPAQLAVVETERQRPRATHNGIPHNADSDASRKFM
jgi:hypothetical protein